MARQRPLITRTAWIAATILIILHLLCWVWVSSQDIQYDGEGNVLWWLVALHVFPILAVTTLAISMATGLLGLRPRFGD